MFLVDVFPVTVVFPPTVKFPVVPTVLSNVASHPHSNLPAALLFTTVDILPIATPLPYFATFKVRATLFNLTVLSTVLLRESFRLILKSYSFATAKVIVFNIILPLIEPPEPVAELVSAVNVDADTNLYEKFAVVALLPIAV